MTTIRGSRVRWRKDIEVFARYPLDNVPGQGQFVFFDEAVSDGSAPGGDNGICNGASEKQRIDVVEVLLEEVHNGADLIAAQNYSEGIFFVMYQLA